MDKRKPIPDARGGRKPPDKQPPTAVGTLTPPPPSPVPRGVQRFRRESGLLHLLRRLAAIPLDLADRLAAALKP